MESSRETASATGRCGSRWGRTRLGGFVEILQHRRATEVRSVHGCGQGLGALRLDGACDFSCSPQRGNPCCRYVWAPLYTSKMPVSAAQILNNHMLPSFEERGVSVDTALSNNRRECWARGPAPPRVAPPARGDRAPEDEGAPAAVETPWPRHGRAATVPGVQEGDPEAPEPEEVGHEGGDDRSLKRWPRRGRVSGDYCTCTTGITSPHR